MNKVWNENELLELYTNCMKFWGLEKQLRMTQEECSELVLAISHFIRGREGGLENLIEELADAQLMINQITYYVGKDKVRAVMDIKSNYVKRKLEEAKDKADG
jgi:NTP pyrophosphatase (non-canonical NTP hydrolase)